MKKLPVYGMSEFFKGQKESPFYVNRLSVHLQDHKFVNSHHKHSTYVTVLFTQGTGEHLIDFESYPVQRGCLFFLNPGQMHCWTLSPDSEGYVFFHNQDFFDGFFVQNTLEDFPFFQYGHPTPLLLLEEDAISKLELLWEELLAEKSKNQVFHPLKIVSLVTLVYIELSRLYKINHTPVEESSTYRNVKKLQKLIDEQFQSKKKPSEYAELLHMTPRHLSRVVTETLHTTPTDLIVDRVVLEAKRLLIHHDANVSSIADKLGYDDTSYFIRLFKKKVGMTPREFQGKMRAGG